MAECLGSVSQHRPYLPEREQEASECLPMPSPAWAVQALHGQAMT